MAVEVTETTDTFDGRKLRVGDMIFLGLDEGGTVYLWPTVVCTVSETGPKEGFIVGKGFPQDFEATYGYDLESGWAYGTGLTRSTIQNMTWIFATEQPKTTIFAGCVGGLLTGSKTCALAVEGDTVVAVCNAATGADLTSSFESTISSTGSIEQTTGSLTGVICNITLARPIP